MFHYDDYDVMSFSEYSVMDESDGFEAYDSAEFAVDDTENRRGLTTAEKILLYGTPIAGAAGAVALGLAGKNITDKLGNRVSGLEKTSDLTRNINKFTLANMDDDTWQRLKGMAGESSAKGLETMRKSGLGMLSRGTNKPIKS